MVFQNAVELAAAGRLSAPRAHAPRLAAGYPDRMRSPARLARHGRAASALRSARATLMTPNASSVTVRHVTNCNSVGGDVSTLDPLGSFPELALTLKSSAVLVADVVESVRLAEEGEQDAIERWVRFVKLVGKDILPKSGGRLVKSTGDGFLLEFKSVPDAVHAGFKIQSLSAHENRDVPEERKEWLRIGIETGRIYVSEMDVFGADVNRAARLAGLAQGGEIVVSAKARDQITVSLDADIEDMGENYLKNIREPVRAYKLRPPGLAPSVLTPLSIDDLLPSIAIIPFSARGGGADSAALGDIIAEELILSMSRSRYVNVISRMSTAGFRDRVADPQAVLKHLNARFMVTGTCRASGDALLVDVELTETRTQRMLWGERFQLDQKALVAGDNGQLEEIVAGINAAIVSREVDRIRVMPMPNLESYTLMLGAISLLHRFSRDDFFRAQNVLEELISRVPRYAAAHAWLANWYTLKVQQGWSEDRAAEVIKAKNASKKALDLDPDNSLSLYVAGLIETNINKRFDEAEKLYSLAVEKNPNESMAWLLKGAMYAFSDQGTAAVSCCEMGRKLSPLDPQKFFYDSLSATAYFTARRYPEAAELAKQSLRSNKLHASTLRVLALSRYFIGEEAQALEAIDQLRMLEPNFSISEYVARAPSAAFKIGDEIVRAFRALGVKEK